MSFFKLTFSKVASFQNYANVVQKRYVHRAPDLNYMSLWKKSGIDYMEKMGRFSKDREYNAGFNMYRSPQLVEQILRVTVAMKQKGFIPFVHAMPASAKVIMKFAEVMYPMKAQESRHFKYLRPPTCANKAKYEEVVKIIPQAEGVVQSQLLSMSYALTCGTKWLETAASWGFVNHFGREQYFPMMNRYSALIEKNGNTKAHFVFRAMSGALIGKYNRLQVGDFQVIGVPPEKINRFVYDSKPYNIPTGKDVKVVAADPVQDVEALMANGSHMATMMIFEETLDPASGLCIVNASDAEEAKSFCEGISFTPMKEVAAYADLVGVEATEFEKTQLEQRREADDDLQKLVAQFKSAKDDPEKIKAFASVIEEASPYDLPQMMP
jgi:hypothetical protein